MKIRTDFVTNSSSTNFIIITSKDFNKEDFIRFLGFKKNSPFWDDIGEAVDEMTYEISENFTKDRYYADSRKHFEDFVKKEFSEETYAKVVEAKNKEKKIYYGRFRSEEPKFLSFFCCDSILIENDNIYFDATECTW